MLHNNTCVVILSVISRLDSGLNNVYETREFLMQHISFCHQYFLISNSSTQYTPVSNWSNRPLLSGATTFVHGCSVCALGPSGESSHTAGGVAICIHLYLSHKL